MIYVNKHYFFTKKKKTVKFIMKLFNIFFLLKLRDEFLSDENCENIVYLYAWVPFDGLNNYIIDLFFATGVKCHTNRNSNKCALPKYNNIIISWVQNNLIRERIGLIGKSCTPSWNKKTKKLLVDTDCIIWLQTSL